LGLPLALALKPTCEAVESGRQPDAAKPARRAPWPWEDRLLTGRGQFIADLTLPGMLHAVFVRSQIAHGRIRSIDVARAAAMPGVAHVLTGADLLRIVPPVAGAQLSLPSKWRTQVQHTIHAPQQPMLAVEKVRHVGEAVAVVVAESRYQAQDAAELVAVDIEPWQQSSIRRPP